MTDTGRFSDAHASHTGTTADCPVLQLDAEFFTSSLVKLLAQIRARESAVTGASIHACIVQGSIAFAASDWKRAFAEKVRKCFVLNNRNSKHTHCFVLEQASTVTHDSTESADDAQQTATKPLNRQSKLFD